MKNKNNFFLCFHVQKKLKKSPQKIAYLWQLGGFFSLQPRLPKTAQNTPELHFYFINSFIQSSLLRSLVAKKRTYIGKQSPQPSNGFVFNARKLPWPRQATRTRQVKHYAVAMQQFNTNAFSYTQATLLEILQEDRYSRVKSLN